MKMMKTIYQLSIFCIMALLSIPVVVVAQEDQSLSREMTLEREYDPSVQDANKINTLPAVKEPEVRKIPIDYASFAMPVEPQREIGLLPSGSIMTGMDYNKRRGYFNFGICPAYMNINGDFGYHLVSTDKDQLNIFFSHRSTNGKVKYTHDWLEGEKVKAKLNDNLGGVNYRHQFEKAALRIGGRYGYSGFNYYGLPSEPIPSAEPLSDVKTNQVNQEISFLAGVESREDAPIGYRLDLNYTHFSYKYGLSKEQDGIKENSFGGTGGLSAAFGGNQRIGLDGVFNYFNYSLPDIYSPSSALAAAAEFENHFEGTLSPYYRVEGENWHIKLGANVMYISGDHDKFFVSPNVAMDVTVGSRTVLYLDAGGEIRSNSAYQLSRENRYINPWTEALPSRTWLDATAGVKSGIGGGFWLNFFAGYKITDDDYFFIPRQHFTDFGNVSDVATFDTKLFRAGLGIKYAYQKLFEIDLKGVYNNWKVETGTHNLLAPGGVPPEKWEAFGRPEVELTAGITVRPLERLSIGLDYYLATGRKMFVYSDEFEKMKNINELNLKGAYNFNETFGVYAKLSNLLFQKYEMIYGYPLQRFSGMIGVNINF